MKVISQLWFTTSHLLETTQACKQTIASQHKCHSENM